MYEPIITIIGNLTADPELRFTRDGQPVANVTIANTPQKRNPQTGKYEDEEALFQRATIWGTLGENAAQHLRKGTRVIAQGRLKAKSWETKEGEKRTGTELVIDAIGQDLRFMGDPQGRRGVQSRAQGPQGGQGYSQEPSGVGGWDAAAPGSQSGYTDETPW